MPRNQTIDAAKGLGMILVVFGHNRIVGGEKGELYRIIYSFHVPLFFFLSGVFFRESTTLLAVVRAKAGSLLKPYFVVLVAAALIKAWLGQSALVPQLAGIGYGVGETIAWAPLWFLPHLFVVSAGALIVLHAGAGRLVARPARIGFLAMLLAAGIVLLPLFWHRTVGQIFGVGASAIGGWVMPGLPFSIDLLPITLAFFLLGYWESEAAKQCEPRIVLLGIAFVAFSGLHMLTDSTIDLNLRRYGQPVIATAQALLGTYLVLGIAAVATGFPRVQSILGAVGASSLFILLFHATIQANTIRGLQATLGWGLGPAGLAGLILGIGVPIILGRAIERTPVLSKLFINARGASSEVVE